MTEHARKISQVPLKKLRPHPKQSAFFRDVPEAELQALAADILANGQREPILVTKDLIIIAGHQRVRAARRNGWTTIAAILREDLDLASSENVLLADNLNRRHLSALERARCIRRLLEISRGRKPGGLREREVEKVKAEIGARLGISLRSVNRYLLVLGAPKVVQDALEKGEISLVVAGRVALLDEFAQADLIDKIEEGQSVAAAIADALRRAVKAVDVKSAIQVLVKSLDRAHEVLHVYNDLITAYQISVYETKLRRGVKLLKDLLARAESAAPVNNG